MSLINCQLNVMYPDYTKPQDLIDIVNHPDVQLKVTGIEKYFHQIDVSHAMETLSPVSSYLHQAYVGSKGHSCNALVKEIISYYRSLIKEVIFHREKSVQDCLQAIRWNKSAISQCEKSNLTDAMKSFSKCSELAGQMADASGKLVSQSEKLCTLAKQAILQACTDEEVDQVVTSLEVTLKSLAKIKTVFEKIPLFWNCVKTQCSALRNHQETLEIFSEEDLCDEFKDELIENTWNWVVLGWNRFKANQAMHSIDGHVDQLMSTLFNKSESMQIISQIFTTTMIQINDDMNPVGQQVNMSRLDLKKISWLLVEMITYTNEHVRELECEKSVIKKDLLNANEESTKLEQKLTVMRQEVGALNNKMAGLGAQINTIQEDIASIDDNIGSRYEQCENIEQKRLGAIPLVAGIQSIEDNESLGTIVKNFLYVGPVFKAIHSFSTESLSNTEDKINKLFNEKMELDDKLNSIKKKIRDKEMEKSYLEEKKKRNESEKQINENRVKECGIELTGLQNIKTSLELVSKKFHFISEDVQLHDQLFHDIKYDQEEVRWLLQEAKKISGQFMAITL